MTSASSLARLASCQPNQRRERVDPQASFSALSWPSREHDLRSERSKITQYKI